VRVWLARGCIAIVFFANLQCAIAFIASPEAFAPSYELSGVIGNTTIQAIGVLFLMWNVPYAVALWHPVRYRISLAEAVVMQAIGVVGESILLNSLPGGYPVLRLSLRRFVVFDATGLLLLIFAAWVVFRKGKLVRGGSPNHKQ
jgi:hypothetical protein